MSDVITTLQERGKIYGEFTGHAEIAQALKEVMRGTDRWHKLSADQAEALEMIQHKIARILNGNPDYADSWVDIEGYARLVRDRLQKGEPAGKAPAGFDPNESISARPSSARGWSSCICPGFPGVILNPAAKSGGA